MTRTLKIAIGISAALGFTVGGSYGYWIGNGYGEVMKDVRVMAITWAMKDYAALQFKFADTAHAREAALSTIRVLEQLRDANRGDLQEGELGFAYARLGLIEEADGEQANAHVAFDRARVCFKRSDAKGRHPHKEMTDQELRDAVKRMDQISDRYRL